MLKAKLVVVGGDTQFEQVDLKLPVVIGRGADVDLAVTDELISRRHAEIIEQDGRLLVRDLGSRNGTFVNNRRIDGLANLEPDQLLTLGTITFRAQYRVEQFSHSESSQMKETVRIHFNETERISLPVSGYPLFQAAGQVEESQDELETVDLDDFRSGGNSGHLPVTDDRPVQETIYGRTELPGASRVETVAAGNDRAPGAAQYLRQRFPK